LGRNTAKICEPISMAPTYASHSKVRALSND
jgi:hypothetical protein